MDIQKQKDDFLKEHGLAKKVFFEGDPYKCDFPNEEYSKRALNPETQSYNWYKEVPFPITDEQFKALLSGTAQTNEEYKQLYFEITKSEEEQTSNEKSTDSRVEEYIVTQKKKKDYLYRKKKEEYLIKHSLTEKIFAEEPENEDEYDFPNDEYPKYGKNPETGKYGYYKEVPIQITDEEYEKILEADSYINDQTEKEADEKENVTILKESKENENPIAKAISIIAILIFLFSFIFGIVYGNTYKTVSLDGKIKEEFNLAAMIIVWAIGAVSGIVLLGLAEIIKLLQKIHDNQR